MRLTLILCSMVCLAVSATQAQSGVTDPVIHWGKEFNEPSNSEMVELIKADKSGFYALRRKWKSLGNGKSKYLVERYNAKMNLIKAQELPLKHKGKWREFEDVIVLNGKFYMLSSFNNEGKKRNYLFAQEFSEKSLALKPKITKIGEVSSRNSINTGTFDTEISKDSSKFLVIGLAPEKKKEAETFSMAVYNNELIEYWSREVVLPYSSKNFTVEDYLVDNKGVVYILGVLYMDGVKGRQKGLPNYEFVILSYRKEIAEPEELRIRGDNKFITDLTFKIHNDGNLICSGFYSRKGTFSIKGSYYAKVNPLNGDILVEKYNEFDFEFLTADMSKRQKAKAEQAMENDDPRREAELYEYALDDLILRNDGGAVLIAEQYFVEEYRRYEPSIYGYNSINSNYSYSYEYHYNDIIVVNIKPDGAVEWAARIPKKQFSVNDSGYYSSYAKGVTGEKLYFIFNDNLGNERQRIFRSSDPGMIVASVGTDGNVEVSRLGGEAFENVITRPKVCEQVGKNEMLIYCESGKRFRFAKLNF